jgi:hypothetical protein
MGHTVGVVNLVVKLVVKLVVIYTPRRGWGTHPLKELMLLSSRRGKKKRRLRQYLYVCTSKASKATHLASVCVL